MNLKKTIHRTVFAVSSLLCAAALSGMAYGSYLVPDRIRSDAMDHYADGNLYSWQSNPDVEAASQSASARTLTMLGVFPVKTVQLVSGEEPSVLLGGTPFGCVVQVKNVLVVGFSDVRTKNGVVNPAKKAGICPDDVIVSVNGKNMHTVQDLSDAVSSSNGAPMQVVYRRAGVENAVTIAPAYSEDEAAYKIGLWVRDSEAGVGILSFYDPQSGVAVGLGHALKDSDTGKRFVSQGGTAYPAQVLSITKGEPGSPGQLSCSIQAGRMLGRILLNGNRGVYVASDAVSGREVPLAPQAEAEPGDATLYVTLDENEPQEYRVRIEKVREHAMDDKNLTIRVVDERLIEKTGGIVQGMSGSPILQNGKLVGVLTHVLVDDPTSGYAIFAETLLSTARQAEQQEESKQAS